VSDADGKFKLPRERGAAIELDARTLPGGWIMSPRDESGSPNEFGVVPTAALDVKVDAASDSTNAGPGFRFGGVTIAVVDSAGRKWVVRTDTRRALFDALPAGSYRIEAEVADASEPLVVDVSPAVDVVAGRVSRATVTLRRRPVRLFRSTAPAASPPPKQP